ncbi:MAG: MBL fold metallo-hydrolase [Clostridiaceae bacterium]|nr:MBL fold metallo-hydrolase [Eubacteriales bacterium]
MRTEHIGTRSVLLSHEGLDWGLNLQLIFGKEHNFLIDTGLGYGSAEPVKALLREDKKPLVVVNTHHHWDHVWGNGFFEGSLLVSHALCRQALEETMQRDFEKYRHIARGEVRFALPSLTFDSALFFPADNLRIFYSPGHTDDCVSVFDEEDGILNAGDNIGDTDEEIVPELACDAEVYRDTLDSYRALDFKLCVSGHNRPRGFEVLREIETRLRRNEKL